MNFGENVQVFFLQGQRKLSVIMRYPYKPGVHNVVLDCVFSVEMPLIWKVLEHPIIDFMSDNIFLNLLTFWINCILCEVELKCPWPNIFSFSSLASDARKIKIIFLYSLWCTQSNKKSSVIHVNTLVWK